MKLRLSLMVATFLVASYAVAQDPGSSTSQTAPASQPTATQPAQTGQTPTGQAPAPIPGDEGGIAQSPDNTKTQSGKEQPPLAEPADPSKVKHDGGKNDVDAIGNRKMGNRGLGNWYSIEGEVRMGKAYAQQVESSSKMITDPVVTEYVNRIGQNLVRNSDAQVPFTIKVIDSDVVNAMALPGGFFYVNSGLILAADDEAELAGVMSHEIAHVCARHITRQMTRSNYASLSTIPLIFVGGGIGYAAYNAAGLAIPMTMLSFQRGFEAEADYLGLQYMYKAGYDPQAFVAFFEKVQAMEKKKPGTLDKAFSTHPQTPDRIEATQKEIATILPARPEYTETTSEFDDVKARLAQIENRRKLNDTKDGSKPSLRRASTSDKNGNGKDGNSGSTDDDRPTLKRRDDSSN